MAGTTLHLDYLRFGDRIIARLRLRDGEASRHVATFEASEADFFALVEALPEGTGLMFHEQIFADPDGFRIGPKT